MRQNSGMPIAAPTLDDAAPIVMPMQSLAALTKTCGDRLPRVQEALRMAGIELPEEWEPRVRTRTSTSLRSGTCVERGFAVVLARVGRCGTSAIGIRSRRAR